MTYKLAWSAAGLCGLLCASGVAALDYDYSLYSSAEYTDNIRQGAGLGGEPPSGSVLEGGIDFDLATGPGTTFASEVSGDFSRRWYSEGGLEAEDRKSLDAILLYQPSSSNFSLAVLESLQQVAEDRRVVRSVNNTRDVNVFSVVPSYFFDLTSRSRIRTTYSYSRIDDELDLASREVNSLTGGYEYQISNLSALSLNVRRSDVEFTDIGNQYEQESAFIRWAYTGRLTNWALDLGQEHIVDQPDVDQVMVNLSLDRQINSFSSLGLAYFQGFSDAVGSQVGGRLTALVPNSEAVFADDLASEKQLTLSYGLVRGHLEGRLALEARTLQSEDIITIGRPVDEDRYRARLGLDYRFNSSNDDLSAFGIGASYRYTNEDFNLTQEFNEINEASLRLTYFATRSTNLFVELRSRNTAGTAPESDTDENAAIIGIRFSPRAGI
jgi:hypothetical protein